MTRALILGGVSWNTMLYMDEFPEPVPHTAFASGIYETVGSSGAGKALNLRQLDVRAIKAKAKALEGEARQQLLARAARAAEYAELFHHLHGRLRELAESQRSLAGQAKVAVGGPVTAGVELRIGEHSLKVTQDATNVTYRLVEEDGDVKLKGEGQA